jgi:hypothetical protein
MTSRFIPPTFALPIILILTGPAPATEDAPVISGILDRIGALPTDMIKAKKADGEIVEGLFLAALLWLPTDKEKETAIKHLAGRMNREEMVLDLAWALINTKEFSKLHGLDKDVAESLRIINSASEKWGKGKGQEKR